MPAYLAFLTNTGINNSSNSMELANEIRPVLNNGALVAPTDDQGALTGDTHFSIIGPVAISPYDRWVEVESYSFNVRNADEAGRSECLIFLKASEITPTLVKRCAISFEYAYVRLEVWLGSTTAETRLAITMKDVTMTDYRGYSGTVSDGQGAVTDGNLSKCTFKYRSCEWAHLRDANNLQNPQMWETG